MRPIRWTTGSLLRVGSGPAGIAGIFLLLGIYGARWLGLSGTQLWLFRSGIWILGLAAAGLVFWYMRSRERARPTQDDATSDAIAAAGRKLPGSGARSRISGRPLVLVTGPTDSAKTTVLVRSGMEPELLAGQVWQGDEIAPTRGVNLWLASDTVWVEAGGPLLSDADGWKRLVRSLRPARWAAAFSRGSQPPRAVVVCFNCNELLKPGAVEQVEVLARQLRDRVAETARELGVRLPVYVLFTKADRIPHFHDFVRSLTAEEAQEVLGATLPVPPVRDAASHPEQENYRLQVAFGRILHALSLRRSSLLAREGAPEIRSGAYEFPRELRRIVPAATRFLVELCRPGQVGPSPVLRGFYFTGVRPVVVADGPVVPHAQQNTPQGAAGATAVFDPRALVAAAQGTGAPAQGGSRRIPQWTFLPRVFPQIVGRDRVAMALTAGGSRVNLLRRLGLGLASLLLLGVSVGMVRSWVANTALLNEARIAMAGAEGVGVTGERPLPGAELVRLDALRAVASRIRDWELDGRPRRMGYGLYMGNRVLPPVRTVYFERFERGMWGWTRDDLAATVTALGRWEETDAGVSVEYGQAYDALKAYLVTTRFPEYSTPEFLTPALLPYWPGNREVDPERVALAALQFDFFARELAVDPPYLTEADETRVRMARDYLARFADADQFYQLLLTGAAEGGAEPLQFHQRYPGSEASVRSTTLIPAAFTREGWTHVHAILSDVDRLFARESWVLGDRVVAPADRQRLAQDLGERYREEYAETWARFLEEATVLSFQGVPDAERKLAQLSGNQSPILQLLALVSANTAVDTAGVSASFQPVHTVMPPEVTDRFITQANQSYVQGLAGVHSAFERAAAEQGAARTAALGEASSAAEQSRMQVRQIAQAFNVDAAAAPVGGEVQRLLMAPLDDAERLARAGPAAEAGAQAANFCSVFTPLVAKYPFNLRGSAEATLDEVAAMFQPGASLLSSFEQEALQGLVVPQGTGFGAAPGATVRPSEAFLRFFTRAKQVSRAFYRADGSGPEVAFTLRPQATEQLPEIFVTVDGQRQEVSRTSAASRTFVWDAMRAGEARIEAVVAGNRVTLAAHSGTWSVFRMFHQARWETIRPNLYQVTWTFQQPQVTMTAEVSFDGALPVFDPAFLGGMECVTRVTN